MARRKYKTRDELIQLFRLQYDNCRMFQWTSQHLRDCLAAVRGLPDYQRLTQTDKAFIAGVEDEIRRAHWNEVSAKTGHVYRDGDQLIYPWRESNNYTDLKSIGMFWLDGRGEPMLYKPYCTDEPFDPSEWEKQS